MNMGLFDKLFKKEELPEQNFADGEVVAYLAGKRLPTAEISDPMFAEEMMGPTIAIVPSAKKSTVVSPVNGTAMVVFPTGHAFGIETPDGYQYLVHIGIDTVNLKGQGFKVLTKQGETVKAGQPMVEVNFQSIRDAGYDPVTMLIVTMVPEDHQPVEFKDFDEVKLGDIINK